MWIRSDQLFVAFGEPGVHTDDGKAELTGNAADIPGGRGYRADRRPKRQEQRTLTPPDLDSTSQHKMPPDIDLLNLLFNILQPIEKPFKVPHIYHPAIQPPLKYPLNHK